MFQSFRSLFFTFACFAVTSFAVDTPLTRQLQTLLTGQAGTSFAAAEVLKNTRYAGYVIEQETPRLLAALQDERAYVVDAAMRCLENNSSWKTPILGDVLLELLGNQPLTATGPNYALCIRPVFVRLKPEDRLGFVRKYLLSDEPEYLLALLPLVKVSQWEFMDSQHYERLLTLLAQSEERVAVVALEALFTLLSESHHEKIAEVIFHLEGQSENLHTRARELFFSISPHSERDRDALREGLLATMRKVEPKGKTALLAKALRLKLQRAPLKPKPKSTRSERLNCPGVVLRATREIRSRGKSLGDE